MNALRLTASIVEREALRYTPAGVPVVEFRLRHASQQIEAETPRQIEFEARAIAIGAVSRSIMAAPMEATLEFQGFLAMKSKQSKALVFHVTAITAPDLE